MVAVVAAVLAVDAELAALVAEVLALVADVDAFDAEVEAALAELAAALAEAAAAAALAPAAAASTTRSNLAASTLVVSGKAPVDVCAVLTLKMLDVVVSLTRSRTTNARPAVQLPR